MLTESFQTGRDGALRNSLWAYRKALLQTLGRPLRRPGWRPTGHFIKTTRWLDQIALMPKGYGILRSISDSANELVIQLTDDAIVSAGRTSVPMTMNLINGTEY